MPLGGLLRDLPLIDDPHRLWHGNSTELRRFSRRTRLVGHHRCVPVLRRLGSEKAQRAAGDQRLASPTEFEPVLPLGEGGYECSAAATIGMSRADRSKSRRLRVPCTLHASMSWSAL